MGRRQFLLLFCILVLNMMNFGIIIPIIPFYLTHLGGSGREMGLLVAAFAAAQFLFSPLWGDLSDRFGRRPILLLGIAGSTLAMIVYGQATRLWIFYVGRLISGALGSATLPTAMAFVADKTNDRERSGGMGLISASIYTGMMLGPAFGGWLAQFGLSLPFYIAAGLSLVLLVFAFFAIPESLPPERRLQGASGRRGLAFGDMWTALRGPLGRLFALTFILSFGMSHFWSIFGLYALQRFGYGPGEVGIVMAAMGLGSAVMQSFVVGHLAQRWGEEAVIRWALLASAGGFLLMLTATGFAAVILMTSLFVMATSLVMPMVSALVSKQALTGQGKALGLNNSFMSLGQVIGPIWAGMILDVNLALPFVSGAMVMAIALGTTLIWAHRRPVLS